MHTFARQVWSLLTSHCFIHICLGKHSCALRKKSVILSTYMLLTILGHIHITKYH